LRIFDFRSFPNLGPPLPGQFKESLWHFAAADETAAQVRIFSQPSYSRSRSVIEDRAASAARTGKRLLHELEMRKEALLKVTQDAAGAARSSQH
jgi:hypothetical protein